MRAAADPPALPVRRESRATAPRTRPESEWPTTRRVANDDPSSCASVAGRIAPTSLLDGPPVLYLANSLPFFARRGSAAPPRHGADTLSIVAVVDALVLWLVTAIPMYTVEADMAIEAEPTVVHVVPSADS